MPCSDGRSAGKKVLELRVIGIESGQACGFRKSVVRNIPVACACGLYLIPIFGWLLALAVCGFEFLLMLGNSSGWRLGDDFAGTIVIENRVGSAAPASPG
ncbi:MAG TPA: RDD family protein [Dissulfurispiraceae bacterium]|nr:RDD family protein [Dissulfurispiraceae bacterium]